MAFCKGETVVETIIKNEAVESESETPTCGEREQIMTDEHDIRLPEAELEVMMEVWNGEAPMTTNYLMKAIGDRKGWKAPTLISFLVRLEKRGFITSYKEGKERYYSPVADRTLYLRRSTEHFLDTYHNGSFVDMLNVLYNDRDFTDKEVDELLEWLKRKYR